ncbi:MAG: CDP-diacylglycerol/glycerol-3-phosphate 3-phosphatidyltransferase [Desulfonauticus sp. 38_4375]|nr:MAG: CDP-diacylglycerol/glycerol-3-phosphate 3-phosphatidyltransferase [Desulfonauticus sp. 38_4375]
MFNWANKITFFRIACVPLVVVLLYFPNRVSCFVAMLIFILAALSDLLDGFIARRYNLVTNMGKFLDPLADKLLVLAALIMLSYLHWLEAWISILIIEREVMVTGLRAIAVDKGIVIAADKYGKLKTIVQIIALCPLILHYPWFGFDPNWLGKVLIYIALFLTLFSGANYVYKFYKSVLK